MPTTYLLSQKQNSIFRHQNREVWLLSIEHQHCGEGHWPWRQGDPGCVPMPPATTECLVLALQPSHCTSDVAWSQSCASPFWPSLELFPEVFSAPLSLVSARDPHTLGEAPRWQIETRAGKGWREAGILQKKSSGKKENIFRMRHHSSEPRKNIKML